MNVGQYTVRCFTEKGKLIYEALHGNQNIIASCSSNTTYVAKNESMHFDIKAKKKSLLKIVCSAFVGN